jgi:UDP-N-acetylmuramoylalanine--D-glutamate ligase
MSQVRRCFVFGKDRQVIASMLHVDAVVCETLEQVIAHLIDEVRDQDQVLLSPACASLDQFDNYEHRGDEFGRLVMENFA